MSNKKNRPAWARLKEAKRQNYELLAMIERMNDKLSIANAMRGHYEQSYNSAMNMCSGFEKRLTKALEVVDNFATQVAELKGKLRKYEQLEAMGLLSHFEKENLTKQQ